MERKSVMPKGVYRDRLITSRGNCIDLGERSNIVVDRGRILLAAFIKNGPVKGIQLIKIGRGLAVWDDRRAAPEHTDQQLVDPAAVSIPIPAVQITYLDAAGAVVPGPTHRLSISVTLPPGTPPVGGGETAYPMREFGLFGRLGAEEYMIDYVRHPVIHKKAGDTLERTIRLIF